jgi:hypothetical protein
MSAVELEHAVEEETTTTMGDPPPWVTIVWNDPVNLMS